MAGEDITDPDEVAWMFTDDHRAWSSRGFNGLKAARPWIDAGFTPDEARLWRDRLEVAPDEAAQWTMLIEAWGCWEPALRDWDTNAIVNATAEYGRAGLTFEVVSEWTDRFPGLREKNITFCRERGLTPADLQSVVDSTHHEVFREQVSFSQRPTVTFNNNFATLEWSLTQRSREVRGEPLVPDLTTKAPRRARTSRRRR